MGCNPRCKKRVCLEKIKEQAEVTFYYEEQDVVEQPEVAETVTNHWLMKIPQNIKLKLLPLI